MIGTYFGFLGASGVYPDKFFGEFFKIFSKFMCTANKRLLRFGIRYRLESFYGVISIAGSTRKCWFGSCKSSGKYSGHIFQVTLFREFLEFWEIGFRSQFWLDKALRSSNPFVRTQLVETRILMGRTSFFDLPKGFEVLS